MERVIRIKKGKYTVRSENGEERECFAKGNLKIKSDGIVTGDFVNCENGVIVSVLPRKNKLSRPLVSNVDAVAIIVADPPAPDFRLVDKLLATCAAADVGAVIVANKTDLTDENYKNILSQYSRVTRIFPLSALNGDGTRDFFEWMQGKTVAFTGQSAVGKTTLMNALFGKNSKTGELSEKTRRGKQTTTAAEIVCEKGAEVIDTPGFTAFDLTLTPEKLKTGYTEIAEAAENCRFSDCSHIDEPDCAVKAAVKSGEINKSRYERYVEIYKELKNGKKY